MVARVLFPWLTAWRNTIASPARATMKALPTTPHPPSPLRNIHLHFVRLMPIIADYDDEQNTSNIEISTQGR